MPQMKPMNWIFLFFFMNLIILFLNIKNYYKKNINNYKIKNYKKYNKNNNWMW